MRTLFILYLATATISASPAVAEPVIVLAQADDAEPSGEPAPGGTATARPSPLTPAIEAEARGQTGTFSRPIRPMGPVAPRGPQRPTSVFVRPGTPGGPTGPQGPAGLPR